MISERDSRSGCHSSGGLGSDLRTRGRVVDDGQRGIVRAVTKDGKNASTARVGRGRGQGAGGRRTRSTNRGKGNEEASSNRTQQPQPWEAQARHPCRPSRTAPINGSVIRPSAVAAPTTRTIAAPEVNNAIFATEVNNRTWKSQIPTYHLYFFCVRWAYVLTIRL